MKTERHN